MAVVWKIESSALLWPLIPRLSIKNEIKMFILVIETHMYVLILFNYQKDSLKRTLKKKKTHQFLTVLNRIFK